MYSKSITFYPSIGVGCKDTAFGLRTLENWAAELLGDNLINSSKKPSGYYDTVLTIESEVPFEWGPTIIDQVLSKYTLTNMRN